MNRMFNVKKINEVVNAVNSLSPTPQAIVLLTLVLAIVLALKI